MRSAALLLPAPLLAAAGEHAHGHGPGHPPELPPVHPTASEQDLPRDARAAGLEVIAAPDLLPYQSFLVLKPVG